jgi:hypothetical protein
MGQPACNSRNGIEYWKHMGGESDGAIDESTVEIDIRIEFASNAADM